MDTIAREVISSSTVSQSPIDLASYGIGLLVLYNNFSLVTVYSNKLTNQAKIGAKGNATANRVTKPYYTTTSKHKAKVPSRPFVV